MLLASCAHGTRQCANMLVYCSPLCYLDKQLTCGQNSFICLCRKQQIFICLCRICLCSANSKSYMSATRRSYIATWFPFCLVWDSCLHCFNSNGRLHCANLLGNCDLADCEWISSCYAMPLKSVQPRIVIQPRHTNLHKLCWCCRPASVSDTP